MGLETPNIPSVNKDTKNNLNNELYQILSSEIKETSDTLSNLKDIIEKNYDANLKKVNKIIRDLFKFPKINFESIDLINKLTLALSSQENPISKSYLKVLELIQLSIEEIKPDELIKKVLDIMNDKNIPYIIKYTTVRWLKNNDYMVDSFTAVEISNKLQQKYPNYEWSPFEMTTTGEFTNLFAYSV